MIRRAAKKTVVGIYKVMYTVHCENTLRIEAIECIKVYYTQTSIGYVNSYDNNRYL